jgi:hypothetical protein
MEKEDTGCRERKDEHGNGGYKKQRVKIGTWKGRNRERRIQVAGSKRGTGKSRI